VGFSGRNDKTKLVGAALQHAVHEEFTDRAGPLCSIGDAASDWKQLFRKRQRLNPAAASCGRDDSPHAQPPDAILGSESWVRCMASERIASSSLVRCF